MPGIQTILSELDFVKQNQKQLLQIIRGYIEENYIFQGFSGGILSADYSHLKESADEGLGRPDIYNIELAHLYLLGTNKNYEEEVGLLRSKAF